MKRFKKIIALMIVVTCIFSTSVTAFGATKSISSQRPELYDIETSAYTTQRQFFLYWSDVPGATGYQVYRSTSKSGTYHLVKSVKTPYYNDKSVKDGKLYYYKVRATKKSNGKTSYSKFSLSKGKRALPKLEYLDKVTFSGQKVTITLPKYCSASGYRYYYRDGNDPWKLLRTTSKKTVTLNLPKEKLGYQIKVTSKSLTSLESLGLILISHPLPYGSWFTNSGLSANASFLSLIHIYLCLDTF